MALEHGDLFFVNRSAATYKIEALEIGEYLINNQLPGGGYFVNNGLLSIGNTGNDALTAPIGLHSANSPDNSVLDFDKHFVVQRAGTDVTVTLNFGEIKESFLCNTGVDSGFDTTNCDCLALDFGYISNRLPCPDGGIVDDNGCLEINYCKDGLLDIFAKEGGCLDVKICNDAGIDISNGCIGLDMSYITNNISCGDPDSGLTLDGDCLAVDFNKVLAKINLGIIKSTDQTVQFKSGGNKDLKLGDVDLSVDWTKNPNNGGTCNAKLTIEQGGVNRGTYDPCKGDQTIKISAGSSGGGGGLDPCNKGGITDVNGCLEINFDDFICAKSSLIYKDGCLDIADEPDSCLSAGNLYGNRLTLRREGTGTNPAIAFGVGTQDSNKGFYFGIGGDTGDNRLRFVGDNEYLHGVTPEDCGGQPSGGKAEIMGLQAPKAGVHVGRGTPKEDLGTVGAVPNRFFKSWAFQGSLDNDGKRVFMRSGGYGAKTTKGAPGDSKNYATGGAAGWSPERGDGGSAPPSIHYEMPDPSSGVLPSVIDESKLSQIMDALVGSESVSAVDSNDGLLGFGTINQDYLDSIGVTMDKYLEAPRLTGNLNNIAAIHPSLVRWDYTQDSYHQPDPDVDDWFLKPDQSAWSKEPVALNEKTLVGLALMAVRRRGIKIRQLEDSVAALTARLDAAGIP